MPKSRVLVLEDEILIALDLCDRLTEEGFEVVGPFDCVHATMTAVREGTIQIDAAILDVSIAADRAYDVATALAQAPRPGRLGDTASRARRARATARVSAANDPPAALIGFICA